LLNLSLAILGFLRLLYMGLLFLNYFSVCSLLVYKKNLLIFVYWLCVLYWKCLCWLRAFWWTFRYKIISFANKDNLTFSFPIWIPCTSFACVIALARCWEPTGV
jgi:hypothetical protein